MKHASPYLILFMAGVFAVATCAKAQSPELRRYKLRSAVVEYKMSGAQTGVETIYFDQWGMREAKYTQAEINMMGVSVKKNELTFLDGDWTYRVDLDKKTGAKMPTPLMQEMKEAAKRQGKDFTDMGKEMLIRMGGKKIGEAAVLGKPCEIWTIKSLQTTSWIWQGVTLKTEAKMMGKTMLTEATRVQENPAIPPEKFVLPQDVKITETANPLETLKNLKTQKPNKKAP